MGGVAGYAEVEGAEGEYHSGWFMFLAVLMFQVFFGSDFF